MPCPSWGISAKLCRLGRALRAIPNTTCSKCYGMKGHYPCPSVRTAHDRRIEGLSDSRWVDAMAYLINAHCDRHFRWFDVGDVQDATHLMKIFGVCLLTPQIQHWMPTQERKLVRDHAAYVPDNLCIRVSSIFIDLPHPVNGFPISFVTKEMDKLPKEVQCQAIEGMCGPCRKCWDKNEPKIGYKLK